MKLRFEEVVRATVILIAVIAVAGYAYLFRSEAALGAIIGLLGVGASFLFRSKLIPPSVDTPTVIAPTPTAGGPE